MNLFSEGGRNTADERREANHTETYFAENGAGMSEKRVYGDYLNDILDALRKSRQFTAAMSLEEFTGDDETTF